MANTLLADGFDTYNGNGNVIGLATRWTHGGNCGLTSSTPFSAGLALDMNSTDNLADGVFSAAAASFTLHCQINMQSAGSGGTQNTFRFYSGATLQVGIGVSATGEIIAYRNTTELGRSAAGVLPQSTWEALAIEVVISDTVGRVTAYVEGVQVLNLTSQDTRNGAPTDCDRITVGTASTSQPSFLLDDLYIHDSATKLAKHPKIVTLAPNADGGTLNFTPSTGTSHFAMVDELPANNYTDYLSASTVGDVDELGLTNLATTPDTIYGVQVVCYAKKTDAVARSIAGCGVKSGATTSDGSNMVLTTTGGRQTRTLDTDPATSAAWTESGINALELRPKVTV